MPKTISRDIDGCRPKSASGKSMFRRDRERFHGGRASKNRGPHSPLHDGSHEKAISTTAILNSLVIVFFYRD